VVLAHFRWDVAWRGQTEALFAIQAEKTAWDAAVAFAEAHPNEDEAIKFVSNAFEQFRARTYEAVRSEMGEFFKATQPPSVKPPGT
jgi:hypothetical protein